MEFIFLILLISLLLVFVYLVKKWGNGPLNPIKKDLSGKLIIITGSSDGIGLETAKDLINSNAKVIFACRNKNKTENIINNLPEDLKKNAFFEQLDLSSFKSIEIFVKEIKTKFQKIDILINNAGIASDLNKTEDGFINIFQVNYLGNVLLTLLLLDHFNDKESRIINVSSMGYKYSKLIFGYFKLLNNYDFKSKSFYNFKMSEDQLYIDSKLLLIYFSQYLANYFEKKFSYLKIVCLHPGVIFTNIIKMNNFFQKLIFNVIFRPIFFLIAKDAIHGAQTTLFLAYSDNRDLVNGGYYNNLKIEKYTPIGRDEKLRNEMVNETLNILKTKYKELEYLPLSE